MSNYLSAGENASVVAISDSVVAKQFEMGTPHLIQEKKAMEYANSLNDLVVKCEGTQYSEDFEWEYLLMERVYPLQYRALTQGQRLEFFNEFERQLKELHAQGFAHWDIQRPVNITKGTRWDNIILTQSGIRLIDTGNSMYPGHPDYDWDFNDAVKDDLQCLQRFKEVLLA